MKTIDKTNFHKHTFCIFKEVDFTEINEHIPNYKSKSGSYYYFTEEGVYRYSNHWGRAANCKWRLVSNSDKQIVEQIPNLKRTKLGFAKWTDFYPENDFEKLYFIEVDYQNKTANFYHKQNEKYNQDSFLRTSIETIKRIKQIRLLLNQNDWLKYLNVENIETVRNEIIEKIINSNQSFQEIRTEYL